MTVSSARVVRPGTGGRPRWRGPEPVVFVGPIVLQRPSLGSEIRCRSPERFADVVSAVVAFADPVITQVTDGLSWDPSAGAWS